MSALILRAARSIDQFRRKDSNGEVVAWGPRIEADCIRALIWIEEDQSNEIRENDRPRIVGTVNSW